MRIVRLANFITPYSGGLRTALRELGAGYAAAGHEPVLVMPGAADHDEQTPQGRVITLRGPVLPLSGGYRLLLSKRRVRAAAAGRAAAGRGPHPRRAVRLAGRRPRLPGRARRCRPGGDG
jgi:alpha-1,6-mannosyltransferase